MVPNWGIDALQQIYNMLPHQNPFVMQLEQAPEIES